MALETILSEVERYRPRYVCVTGGEPLAQKNCLWLLQNLCDAGYEVSLETSGALDVSGVDARVVKVLDIKTPASGETEKNLWSNLEYLNRHDEIKFVLGDEPDYQWAKQQLEELKLAQRCAVLFSPVQGKLDPKDMAEWILRDRLPVRLQVQMHKLLWGNEVGR
jgi:7-carboxy-7-deazaguanine synthase